MHHLRNLVIWTLVYHRFQTRQRLQLPLKSNTHRKFFWPFTVFPGFSPTLKVSKFQNEFMISSFLPKNELNFLRISALAFKKCSNQKNFTIQLCQIAPNFRYKVPLFFWSDLFLEGRAEILKKFRSFFGRNDDVINSFWNLLTFMYVRIKCSVKVLCPYSKANGSTTACCTFSVPLGRFSGGHQREALGISWL